VRGAILVGGIPIDVRKPHHAAAPTSDNERQVIGPHREGQPAKEVDPQNSLCLERKFVINGGKVVGPVHSSQDALIEHQSAVAHLDLARTGEGGVFPSFLGRPVEEWFPAILGARPPAHEQPTQRQDPDHPVVHALTMPRVRLWHKAEGGAKEASAARRIPARLPGGPLS